MCQVMHGAHVCKVSVRYMCLGHGAACAQHQVQVAATVPDLTDSGKLIRAHVCVLRAAAA